MSSTTSATDPLRWATAFAPASVANVAIGFDILGFSVGALGDRVIGGDSASVIGSG